MVAIIGILLTTTLFYNVIHYYIFQGILIDILSYQYYGNISLLKLSGLLALVIIIKNKDFKELVKLKITKILIVKFLFLILSLLYFSLISPWESSLINLSPKINFLKGVKQLGTIISEIGCIFLISIFFLKKGLRSLKSYYLISLIFALGVYLEFFLHFDFYSFFTNGTKLLLENRQRGFTFEPRAASYYSAILMISSLILLKRIWVKGFFFLLFLGTFILSNSMTGIVLLGVSLIILTLVSLMIKASYSKNLISSLLIILLSLPLLQVTNSLDKIKNKFNDRAYLFKSKQVSEKLEYADSAALNFFLINPKFLLLGIGTGQAAAATSTSMPKSKADAWKDGLTYLPFMGIMLILTNGGFFLLALYLAIIIYGLGEIFKMKIEKETRDLLFTFTCLFMGTYFLQVRYFHILGFAFMLYAEMYNKKYGYREVKFFDNSSQSLRKKIISNAKHLFSEKIIKLIGNFAISIFIANLLGPERYGNYAFVLSFVYIFLPLIDFGVAEFIIKDLTNSKRPKEILSSAFKFRFFTSLAMITLSILSYAIMFYDNLELVPYVIIFSGSFLFRSMDVAYHLFQAQLKNHIITQLNNVVFAVLFVAKVIAVYLSQDIITFIVISSFENIFQGILYFYALKKEKHFFDFKDNNYKVSKYVKAGVPILLSTIIGSLYLRMDQIFIQKFLTPKELGIYALAVRFVNVTTFIPHSIAIIGYPLLITKKTKESIKNYFNISAVVAVITTIGILTIFPLILGLTIKPEYADSTDILRKLSLVIFPMFFNIINLKILVAYDKIGFIFKQNTMILIINVFLNYLLIEQYRLDGVIAATLAAYAISYIILAIFSKEFRLYFKSYLLPNPKRIYRLIKDIK